MARRQHQSLREDRPGRGRHDLTPAHERIQAPTLIVPSEVALRLGHRVRRREHGHACAAPEHEETGVGAIRGREQDVGIEKDPVHRARPASALAWPVVSDRPRIDAQLPDGPDGGSVVTSIDGIRKEKLRDSSGRVHLDGHRDGGPDQDALGAFLGDDERAFLDPELATHPGGDDDGTPLSHPARLGSSARRLSDCLIFWHQGNSTGSGPRGQAGLRSPEAGATVERAGMTAVRP